MTWFSYGRSEGFPTQYPPAFNPVTSDVLESGFIAAFIILFLCFIISLPSSRWKTNACVFIRVSTSLVIGLLIMLSNFGQEWEVGHVVTRTPYRAGTGAEINASIGIKIGLRCVNVTLKAEPDQDGPLAKEIINYNERFEWTWDQGRFGFGPYAGHLQQQFRAAQYRGLPTPILWVVDYFVIDGEGFRYGRFYRTAGWYTHIVIWTALPCWLIANIFFRSVIRYGAYFMGMTGGLMLFGNILWSVIRNPNPLVIPFEDATMVTKFGSSYWLTFVTGVICLTLSIVIVFLEANFDVAISIFFGVDPLTNLDEYILTQSEIQLLRKHDTVPETTAMPLTEIPGPSSAELDPNAMQTVYVKRKSTMRIVRPARIKHIFPPNKEDEQPLYGNIGVY